MTALRNADRIGKRGLDIAEHLTNPSTGIIEQNDSRTEGALAEYEGAITTAAHTAKSMISRVEQLQTEFGVITDGLLSRCGNLARRLDAEVGRCRLTSG